MSAADKNRVGVSELFYAGWPGTASFTEEVTSEQRPAGS